MCAVEIHVATEDNAQDCYQRVVSTAYITAGALLGILHGLWRLYCGSGCYGEFSVVLLFNLFACRMFAELYPSATLAELEPVIARVFDGNFTTNHLIYYFFALSVVRAVGLCSCTVVRESDCCLIAAFFKAMGSGATPPTIRRALYIAAAKGSFNCCVAVCFLYVRFERYSLCCPIVVAPVFNLLSVCQCVRTCRRSFTATASAQLCLVLWERRSRVVRLRLGTVCSPAQKVTRSLRFVVVIRLSSLLLLLYLFVPALFVAAPIYHSLFMHTCVSIARLKHLYIS